MAASPKKTQSWTSGSNAIGASLTMALTVALFGYGGHALDARWETEPWFLLLGCALGLLGGFMHLLKHLAPETFAAIFVRRRDRGAAQQHELGARGQEGDGAEKKEESGDGCS